MKRELYAPFYPETSLPVERLGVVLLGAVESEVSVYVLLDRQGKVSAFKFFDTLDSAGVLASVPQAERIVLFSGHPQMGYNLTANDDDLRNLSLLPEGAQLYLVHEHTCVKA